MKPHRAPLASAPILNVAHELSVHRLKQRDDSFSIHYTITPPLPDQEDNAPVLLALEATDDLGSAYLDWGGAYGTAADGTHTNGSISAQPVLAAEATEVRIRIMFLREGEEHPIDLALRTSGTRL
ncbi:hypothetical protein [Streptomyces nigrescens]